MESTKITLRGFADVLVDENSFYERAYTSTATLGIKVTTWLNCQYESLLTFAQTWADEYFKNFCPDSPEVLGRHSILFRAVHLGSTLDELTSYQRLSLSDVPGFKAIDRDVLHYGEPYRVGWHVISGNPLLARPQRAPISIEIDSSAARAPHGFDSFALSAAKALNIPTTTQVELPNSTVLRSDGQYAIGRNKFKVTSIDNIAQILYIEHENGDQAEMTVAQWQSINPILVTE